MEISGINAQNVKTGYDRLAVQKTEINISGLEVNATQEGDQVSISAGAVSIKSTQVLLERAYAALETNVAAGQDAFEAAGKSDYLASIADATDNSPDAVSDRIFKGITGYIFGAFVNNNPDYTAEEFADFKDQVMSGVQQGAEEAREIITALSALSPEVDNTINDTLDMLYSKLDDFFTEIEEGFGDNTDASSEGDATE